MIDTLAHSFTWQHRLEMSYEISSETYYICIDLLEVRIDVRGGSRGHFDVWSSRAKPNCSCTWRTFSSQARWCLLKWKRAIFINKGRLKVVHSQYGYFIWKWKFHSEVAARGFPFSDRIWCRYSIKMKWWLGSWLKSHIIAFVTSRKPSSCTKSKGLVMYFTWPLPVAQLRVYA